jgi:proline iminopeptidase
LTEGTVRVDGSALAYRVEGSGPPVMVLGSATYYPRTFSARFRTAWRVAFADLRHFAVHDPSVAPAGIGLDTYTDDVERLRRAIGYERFVAVGHSHHGNLVLEYAKRYPERVSHLVLIGSPPCDVRTTVAKASRYWDRHASDARKAALERARASLAADADFATRYAADGPRYWYDPAYDARPLWEGVPVNPVALDAFKRFFVDYELAWDPARMTAPVLVVMGRHDYVVPHTLWDRALPGLRNVTYRLLERSGHTPQLEEPDLFDRTVHDWLA